MYKTNCKLPYITFIIKKQFLHSLAKVKNFNFFFIHDLRHKNDFIMGICLECNQILYLTSCCRSLGYTK